MCVDSKVEAKGRQVPYCTTRLRHLVHCLAVERRGDSARVAWPDTFSRCPCAHFTALTVLVHAHQQQPRARPAAAGRPAARPASEPRCWLPGAHAEAGGAGSVRQAPLGTRRHPATSRRATTESCLVCANLCATRRILPPTNPCCSSWGWSGSARPPRSPAAAAAAAGAGSSSCCIDAHASRRCGSVKGGWGKTRSGAHEASQGRACAGSAGSSRTNISCRRARIRAKVARGASIANRCRPTSGASRAG